jgi:hypothetical protein
MELLLQRFNSASLMFFEILEDGNFDDTVDVRDGGIL